MEKEKSAEEAKVEKTGQEEKSNNPQYSSPQTFTNLLFSISTSVLISLGEMASPETGEVEKNLEVAKNSIDLLVMLKEKTEGNLTSDEDKFLESMLADLKLRYVKAVK